MMFLSYFVAFIGLMLDSPRIWRGMPVKITNSDAMVAHHQLNENGFDFGKHY